MATVTLKLEGPPGKVPADALARVLTESLAILENLRLEVAKDEPVTWYVTDLRIASAQVAMSTDTPSTVPLRLGREYVSGLRIAESGSGLPDYFSDGSLTRLSRISKQLQGSVQGLQATVSENGTADSVRVSSQSGHNLAALRRPRSRAMGSITGALDMISLRGRSNRFQVFDPVSRRPVACTFPEERTAVVKDALGERVTVSGVVVRNTKGQPVRVEKAEFQLAPPGPPLTQLVGIDPDFTGDLTFHDYLERISS